MISTLILTIAERKGLSYKLFAVWRLVFRFIFFFKFCSFFLKYDIVHMSSLPINLQQATFSLEAKIILCISMVSWKPEVLSSCVLIILIFIKYSQSNLYSQCFGFICLKCFCWAYFCHVSAPSGVCSSSALLCSASKPYICGTTSITQL